MAVSSADALAALKTQLLSGAASVALERAAAQAVYDLAVKGAATLPAPPAPAKTTVEIVGATLGLNQVEGSAGGLTYWVYEIARKGVVSGPTTIDWSVTGFGPNPAGPEDFDAGRMPSGRIWFGGGETRKQVWIGVMRDAAHEVNESFRLNLLKVLEGDAAILTPYSTGVILDDDSAGLPPAPAPPPSTPPPPALVPPPAPVPPPGGVKALVSALPAGLGPAGFDEPFTDQARMAWHHKLNPLAPFKRNYYFNAQLEQAGYEDAGSRQGENDLQIYTDAYYPTGAGIETVQIVGGRARVSLLANPDTTDNKQLQQWFGGHPTPSGRPVKRLGALMTTEKSFAMPYGYWVARVNLDRLTPGCWPAVPWLLPHPADIAKSAEWKELDGYEGMIVEPKKMFITYHGGEGLSIWPEILTPGFHDIGVLVTKTSISTLLDGTVVPGSVKANKFPPGLRWYGLIGLAVGGWDGQERMEAPALPAFMELDYFKAYPAL